MEKFAYIGLSLLLTALVLSELFSNQQADWKRGRVYHRLVCTSCHIDSIGRSISPMDKTVAQWTDYYQIGKHRSSANQVDLKYYTSVEYRLSIKHYNLAAEKFIDLPSQQLQADILAFALRGAKDSTTPMRCQ